ncbi:MAG: type II toxin-antitoxin system RelE/ParE family toxin [Patescibacteria group bacterium]
MAYEYQYTNRALKQIQKLDFVVRKRIDKTLVRNLADPYRHAERLLDPELGTFKFRIGDYRVFFDIVGECIIVLKAGHRRDVYNK